MEKETWIVSSIVLWLRNVKLWWSKICSLSIILSNNDAVHLRKTWAQESPNCPLLSGEVKKERERERERGGGGGGGGGGGECKH